MIDKDFDMNKQQIIHAYKDGAYQGVVIATLDQLADIGMTEGPEPKPSDLLIALREITSISKGEFCLSLMALDVLTASEATASARGDWPASLSGFLEYLSPEESAEAQIDWAPETSIHRNNVFVLLLASYMGIPDKVVDAIFGISAA